MKIREEQGLSFDDVLLVPRKSYIKSRFDGSIDLSVQLTPSIKLSIPFISAAMDTITEADMANEIGRLGGLGLVHRFTSDLKAVSMYRRLNSSRVITIGLGKKGLQRLEQVASFEDVPTPDAVHIDVAYAWTPFMIDFVNEVKSIFPHLDVIVGSVATGEAVCELAEAGVDAVRVGVGPGSRCSTRVQTGNGSPQLTALTEAHEAKLDSKNHITIICDGGVKNAGDCVKALAAGADVVMTGRLFAGSDECPTQVISLDGKKVKEYRGMSSTAVQEQIKDRSRISEEGVSSFVPCVGPVEDVIQSLVNNMLSGFSYQDAHNITELQENAEFVKISSAGMYESMPRK